MKLKEIHGLKYQPVAKSPLIQTRWVMRTISQSVSGPHWGTYLELSNFQIKAVLKISIYFLYSIKIIIEVGTLEVCK